MKFCIKNVYLIFFLIFSLSYATETLGKDKKIQYSKDNISNYFSGIVSANYNLTSNAFKHLNKVQFLKTRHSNYNIQFLRTLILLKKFEEAFSFSKSVWNEGEFFFEADIILGLNYFINEDYSKAEKYFERLNIISEYNFIFQNLIGNVLIAWSKASSNNKEDSFKYIAKIPNRYDHIKQIQNSFLQCHFNTQETESSFERLIGDENYNFSRYNFFLVNYLLSKKQATKAKKIISASREKHNSNLLIKETDNFILNKQSKKIKNFFNCQNPKDVIAEFFYILANLYSSEEDYKLSNFYLNISLFLNDQFLPNKALLAENYYYQKKYKLSRNIYNSLKSIGPAFSWYSSKSISVILLDTQGKEKSISSLENEFNLLKKHNFEHYYELANFYKDNEYFKESIKYYSLALQNIKQNHDLVPKILDRRGTSYERLGEWIKAEKDLTESLKISPDQPYVLNYLAYSWIEKGVNLDKALEMLKRATDLRKNDGYIIDSLGWGYYARKNYVDAERFLQEAVELKPLDPVINDHYADALWMLKKNIQARYVWKYVLGLDTTEQQLKENINHKLIFGINKKL